MKSTTRRERVAPRASVLIESMRDIGYSLESALADIVDNSIAAQASVVQLLADTHAKTARIAIIDNGQGMSEATLLEAMRPGSRSPLEAREHSDLGRFGLGLKTASFSQCRRLTVVSRSDGVTSAARWDLDLVADLDDWMVEILSETDMIPWIDRLGKCGTLVLWEKLDRLLEGEEESQIATRLVQKLDEARSHLELVFHRFLSGESGLRRVTMQLNDRDLVANDPFHRSHPATIADPVEQIKVGDHRVTVQAFTLPHHTKVSPTEWEKNAGSAGYLKNQGFYLYREKRLIIHGTWFGLARQQELTKLARVRIDTPNDLDSQWKIDVKKSSAQPPFQVRERLKRIIDRLGATSRRVYTVRGTRLTDSNPLPVWIRFKDKNQIGYRVNAEHPVIANVISRVSENIADDLDRALEIVSAALPVDSLFADLGGHPTILASNTASEDALTYAIESTYSHLLKIGKSPEAIAAIMLAAEPFRSQAVVTKAILKRLADGGIVE